jgi:hypothetical protein
VHVFTLKDGKVARFREHADTAQFAEAFAAAGEKIGFARRFYDEVCNKRRLAVAISSSRQRTSIMTRRAPGPERDRPASRT